VFFFLFSVEERKQVNEPKMERMAGLLLVLMVWFTAVAASTPSASPPPQMVASPWRPVAVNLQVAAVNHTGLVKVARRESRTVPAFFEETLGILRGQPLTFDVDRWRAIQRSGLFKNLTAKAFANPDGEVTLHVYGEELPSVRFSPEVSVAASLDKPEASGGVVFSDRNFRGMGQRLDIQVTKKEGTEAGTDALRPTVTVKWGGNGIGKTTSVSAGYDDESSLQDAADLVPLAQLHARVAAAAASAGTSRHRIQNQVRRAFVKFQDMDFGGLARKHARRGLDAAPLNCLVEVDLEPYIEASHALGDNGNGDGDGGGSTLLQGAKLTAVARWAGGATATAAHDGGVGTYSWGSAPYHQVTMELTSPPLAVRGQPSDATGGSWLRRAFGEVTARVRAKALGSWGGARLPLSHGVALGDAQVIYAVLEGVLAALNRVACCHVCAGGAEPRGHTGEPFPARVGSPQAPCHRVRGRQGRHLRRRRDGGEARHLRRLRCLPGAVGHRHHCHGRRRCYWGGAHRATRGTYRRGGAVSPGVRVSDRRRVAHPRPVAHHFAAAARARSGGRARRTAGAAVALGPPGTHGGRARRARQAAACGERRGGGREQRGPLASAPVADASRALRD